MNNSEAPLVSVVIPTYNHARYLGRAVQSVLEQTYSNWEVIIIDNHSTDNTDEVVASFADSRISYQKIHNKGVIAASRNAGIRAAKGDWVAFLDSDDLWYAKKLEIVANGVKDDLSIDVFSTDEMLHDLAASKKKPLIYGPYCFNFYKALLLTGNRLSTSATVVKREFLNRNSLEFRENREFVTAEDYDFWMLLARAGARFKFIRSIQGEYTIHSNNASGQSKLHQQNLLNVIRDHVYHLQNFQSNKDKLWLHINSGLLVSSAKNMLVERRYVSGILCLARALRESTAGTLSYILFKLIRSLNIKY